VHDDDETIGVGVGERPQQHGVDDAECRGGRADAEREDDDRGDREPRRSPEQPETEAGVLAQGVQKSQPPDVADALLERLDAADLDQRLPAGLIRGDAAGDALIGELLHQGPHFGVEFVVGAGEERAERPKPGRHAHIDGLYEENVGN